MTGIVLQGLEESKTYMSNNLRGAEIFAIPAN